MKELLKYVWKPGLVLAGILSAFYLILFFASKDTFINQQLNLSFIVICTVVSLLYGFKYVKMNEEPISFAVSWQVVMFIIFIGTMGYYLSEMLIYNVLDPALPQLIEDIQKAAFEEKLAAGVVEKANFDKLWPLFEEIDSSYTPKWVFLRGLTNMIYWAVFSLIPAAFIFRQGKARKK